MLKLNNQGYNFNRPIFFLLDVRVINSVSLRNTKIKIIRK